MPEEKKAVHYTEKYDIPTVSMTEVQEQLRLTLEAQQFRGTIILVGDSGVGKTEIIEELAEDFGMRLCIIRTAQFSLLASGVPMTKNIDEGFFKIALPTIFPKPGEKAILLFDELNQGMQHSLATFFSLLETGEMYGYTLPEGCIIVGTMNPATAQYAVTQIESNAALRRRLKFFFINHSQRAWLEYAKTSRFHRRDRNMPMFKGDSVPCHPKIYAYYRINPNKINDDNAREQSKQYTCPATIQTVSLDAYVLDAANIPLHSPTALSRFSSSIGYSSAQRLVAFLEDQDSIVDPQKLIDTESNEFLKVKRLAQKSRSDVLSDLALNYVSMIFTTNHPVEKIAQSLLALLALLPEEIRATLQSQLAPTAKKERSLTYLRSLMLELSRHKAWVDMNIQTDTELNDLINQMNTSSN